MQRSCPAEGRIQQGSPRSIFMLGCARVGSWNEGY